MSLRAAIHQPNFMPWCGYFYKLAQADVFVFLDDCQISLGGASAITHRTRINVNGAAFWLTIPLRTKGGAINEVLIDNTQAWKEKHLRTLRQYYRRAPYFTEVLRLIETLYADENDHLSALTAHSIQMIAKYLGITTPVVVSSQLNTAAATASQTGTARLVGLCRSVGADTYLSGQGAGAARYSDAEQFAAAKIQLEYLHFCHPDYPHFAGNFVAGVSVIDMLFNCGLNSRRLLFGQGRKL